MQNLNSTDRVPTVADVQNLKDRVRDAGKSLADDMNEIAGEILAISHGAIPETPEGIVAGVKRLALLGTLLAEAWADMNKLAAADALTNLAADALASGVTA